MHLASSPGAGADSGLEVLWEDGQRVLSRGWRRGADGEPHAVLTVAPVADHPTPSSLDRLAYEYGLKDELDDAWAALPLDFVQEGGRTILVLKDSGGEPLERLLGAPMEVGCFLRLAIAIVTALGKVHQRGLIHKDIKPGNILVDCADGKVRLTGFGIASRLPRERQAPEPPEFIAGSLAYMAPEQTGRMNRSIDSRSDFYALGITLYQTLTGALPFTAADPMEWVHCHIARKPAPPAERVATVPAAVSGMIMKLLAKTAEERYQTAAGVEHDLRRCLADWDTRGRVDHFPPGAQDVPDRLLIPEKLYGRAREVETLLAAFDRVVAKSGPELVLVSGYSGIGKSSVVNELHKVLVPPRGLFASGKFDQYKRDIPYATLAQAFQVLIRPLLGKSDAELAPLARRAPRGAGQERPAHGDPHPRARAAPWPAATGPGAVAAGRAAPLPVGVPPPARRVRTAGASAGVVPRRPAVAGRGDARPARAPGDPARAAPPAAGRRLSRQRGHARTPADAAACSDPQRRGPRAGDRARAARARGCGPARR